MILSYWYWKALSSGKISSKAPGPIIHSVDESNELWRWGVKRKPMSSCTIKLYGALFAAKWAAFDCDWDCERRTNRDCVWNRDELLEDEALPPEGRAVWEEAARVLYGLVVVFFGELVVEDCLENGGDIRPVDYIDILLYEEIEIYVRDLHILIK